MIQPFNKRSLSIDLKGRRKAQKIARELINKSDGFIGTSGLAHLRNWDSGYDATLATNPGLIYCFEKRVPERAFTKKSGLRLIGGCAG